MKNLDDMLEAVEYSQVLGPRIRIINEIERDSRMAHEDDVFVAIKGTKVDGHQFIDVVKANTIVCEVLPAHIMAEKTYVVVPQADKAWAQLAAAYYDFPSEKLCLIGITGTNGKTSVATILFQLFGQFGLVSGLLSTIEYRIGDKRYDASHTTPDAKVLHKLFAEMVDAGCTHVFMEVSSHALSQERVHGISFDVAVFTNITHDHLNYHGSFKAYIQAKKKLFDGLSAEAVALVNRDDKNASVMLQNCIARKKGFALKRVAEYEARIIENTLEGLYLRIKTHEVWFRLLGSFNAYNLLTAFAVAVELGFEEHEVLTSLSLVEGVAGRFQLVGLPHMSLVGIVDYSHTPDALKNVLQTLKDIRGKKGHIITVVGCGGDRDKAKRPVMGKIASDLSDQAIFTSDNPRSEAPEVIIQEMFEGVPSAARRKVTRITDRKEAIFLACKLAHPDDVILIAGKGHETYQEIQGRKLPFDDREVLAEALRELN